MAPFRSLTLQSLVIFVSSFVGPLLLYKYATWLSYPALVACIMVFGFALGGTTSIACRGISNLRTALAATAGVTLLWIPVVLVTYGFALMATPILVAYGGCVSAGRIITTKVCRGYAG